MDSQTLIKLKPYLLTSGSNHLIVRRLKGILNNNPNIPVSNLRINDTFDEDTQRAVALFQKSRGLLPVTGVMDMRTWFALGAEMNPVQIKNIAGHDKILEDLLGIGYVLAHPHKSRVLRNSMSNAGIHTISANPFASDGFNFTFLVYISVFAPFDWFGPLSLSAGDGATRHFSTDPRKSYRLQCSSTVTAVPGKKTYDWLRLRKQAVTRVSPATTSILMRPIPPIPSVSGIGMPPVPDIKIAESAGLLRREESLSDFELPASKEIKNSEDRLKFHLSGNDDAFALWGGNSLIASDIDVHPNINFSYEGNSKKVLMRAYGNITGDQFPAVESYVRDNKGNGVMLGVWQVREGDGPALTRNGEFGLEGDKNMAMIDFDHTIVVENGLFTGVLKNGRVVSLAEHNQYYINLPTVNPYYRATAPKPAPPPTPTPKR